MTHRPTASELVHAVQEHLTERVLPTVKDPQLKFQTLVAAHVLGVVTRELTEGAAHREEALRNRASLPTGALDDAALCEAIRAGALDDPTAWRALAEQLRGEVEAELFMWNPLFLWRMRAQTEEDVR